MLGMFLNRCFGKVYPEKKITLAREYSKDEVELAPFCKVLVVEEIGDYHNVVMWRDENIQPLVQRLAKVHHVNEARHLAFGRRHLSEIFENYASDWSEKTLAGFRERFVSYLKGSWGDYSTPPCIKTRFWEIGVNHVRSRWEMASNCARKPRRS